MADLEGKQRLRWGILGTGGIAHVFAQGVAASRTGTLQAIGSRSKDTAERFGLQYGVAPDRCHGSYQALLDDPLVDAVYISLPNHLHAEWTIACAAAGKHVLCEKPLTTNYGEAMTVIEAMRRYDVFLMEAFMYRCTPQTAKLLELVRSGVIGEVRLIECDFSYNMGPDYTNIRLSNPAAGGGIMDVGCYPMSMVRLLAGEEPVAVTGVATIGAVSRVDERATASVGFANGIVAALACGTQVETDQELRIWGSQGSIRVPNPWKPVEGPNRILVQRADEAAEDVIVEGGAPLYAIEADTVARYIEARQAPYPCMTWDDSLNNMRALDAWRRAVGLVFDVERPEAQRGPARLVAPPPPTVAMTYKHIPGVRLPLARIVLGTMPIGPGDPQANLALLDYYVSLGGNALDLAHDYHDGAAERAVGEWMALRGNRDRLVLVGKGAHPHGHGPRVNPEAITSDLQESLERLQTTWIDLYILHRDDPEYPVGPIIEILNEHQRAGRIAAFGASNWSTARIAAANAYARAHGLSGFVASSPNLSLAVPNEAPWEGCIAARWEGTAWYEEQQFPLIAWSSLGQGFFSDRVSRDMPPDAWMARVWQSEANFQRLDRARELAARMGATANQVALAWVLHQPFPTFAIIGPYSLDELRTSFEALRLTLTPEDVRRLA
jgi:predicted dehydrogenase/aryl-alcohol dehydrogenase-like predicted oxidoreductase